MHISRWKMLMLLPDWGKKLNIQRNCSTQRPWIYTKRWVSCMLVLSKCFLGHWIYASHKIRSSFLPFQFFVTVFWYLFVFLHGIYHWFQVNVLLANGDRGSLRKHVTENMFSVRYLFSLVVIIMCHLTLMSLLKSLSSLFKINV